MKNYTFFKTDYFEEKLFDYPCVDANTEYLKGNKATFIGCEGYVDISAFEKKGAQILNNHSADSSICVVAPPIVTKEDEAAYYDILDYYVLTIQKAVNNMLNRDGFNHLVVLLPCESDKTSTDLKRMAYYAVFGLVKGLALRYAPKGLFVNGIVMSEKPNVEQITEWALYLSSNNSNNTVGQDIIL